MFDTRNEPASREILVGRLAESRRLTDELFEVVRRDSFYERPIPERHRIVFYVGHLEAFDWNLLSAYALDLKSFHPEFDKLFAFGIDPLGGGLPDDQQADWPALEEIRSYNHEVRERLDGRLEAGAIAGNAQGVDESTLLQVAIEHRLMHAETLAYMFHQLPRERKIAPAPLVAPNTMRAAAWMIDIPAGAVTLGQPRRDATEGGAFGWDNEFEQHTETVPAFAVDAHKVTNGEFLEFLRAGGYENRELWSQDAWDWITRDAIRHPRFWTERNGAWFYRTMFDEVPLPADWPAYVSHAEAAAYARWKNKALPTEAQWHRAAFGTPQGGERDYPWGNQLPAAEYGNFDFHRWDPTPVNAYPAGASAFGATDLVGNGWEWTSSLFRPFPGFHAFPFYPGYSANFFDGKHYVMKGGCARTAACMLRRTFRNWFQSHYPYVYAGFRCVSN
jgi:gamma-glutamyl hercynylcysteine S-oxide synthase